MAGEMLLVVCVVLASVSVIIEVVVGVVGADTRPQQQHLIGHQPA